MDGEQRRHSEMSKQVARADRHIREVQFQVDENKKNHDRLNELVDKLQQKLKLAKRQVEEAVCVTLAEMWVTIVYMLQEELAASNVQKYRQLQGAVEETESRADMAETNLSKLRVKSRSAMTPGVGGLATSVRLYI
jgi:myosin heavy chain 6/7